MQRVVKVIQGNSANQVNYVNHMLEDGWQVVHLVVVPPNPGVDHYEPIFGEVHYVLQKFEG